MRHRPTCPRSGSASTWNPRDTIALGAGRSLRVVDVRDQGEDEPTVLALENISE
jgi:hypothetical protein